MDPGYAVMLKPTHATTLPGQHTRIHHSSILHGWAKTAWGVFSSASLNGVNDTWLGNVPPDSQWSEYVATSSVGGASGELAGPFTWGGYLKIGGGHLMTFLHPLSSALRNCSRWLIRIATPLKDLNVSSESRTVTSNAGDRLSDDRWPQRFW